MEQQTYKAGDKEYTREELIAFGKQHYPKFYMIPRGVGIGFFFLFGTIALIFIFEGVAFAKTFDDDSAASSMFYIYGIVFLIFAIIGLIVFFTSFKPIPEENYLKHAIDYYNKQYANQKAREARIQQNKERNSRNEEYRDVSQLLKYKALLDAGIITQEEYEKKKKELLK